MPTQRYQMMPQGLDPCLCRVPCSVPAAIVLATPAVRRAPRLAWTWCCGSLAPSGGPLAPSMRGPLAGVWLRKVVRGVRGSEVPVEASAGLDGRLHMEAGSKHRAVASVFAELLVYKKIDCNRQVPRREGAQASAAQSRLPTIGSTPPVGGVVSSFFKFLHSSFPARFMHAARVSSWDLSLER